MKAQNENERIIWLDVARSIAIVSITVNHAVNRSFAVNYDQFIEFNSIPIALTIIKTVLYAFSRIGVPLFLMISGALLLPKDYENGGGAKFLKRNWLQLFITTELWLAIMFWYKQVLPGSILFSEGIGPCLLSFVMTMLFLNPVTMGSMWYMEMILCVYLMIPILAIALKKLGFKYFLIPIAIVVFCSFIQPEVNGALTAVGVQFKIETVLESAHVFSNYVVMLLLGYFVAHEEGLTRVKTSLLIIGGSLSFLLFCIFQFWFFSKEYDFVVAKGSRSIFAVLVAVFLFELLKRAKIREKSGKTATGLSRISFGIYFIHICIMEGLVAVINHFGLGITYLWKFLLLEGISFFGSILIIKCLSFEKVRQIGFVKWINKNLLGIK